MALVVAVTATAVVGCGDNQGAMDLDAGRLFGCGGATGGDGLGGESGWGGGGSGPSGGNAGNGGVGQAAGHGGGVGEGGGGDDGGRFFTVITLPDTQYYSSSYPDIFEAQMRWILDQRTSQRIAFVLHEGDIVDSDVSFQWENASRSLHKLDGVVPYVVTQGNHDYLDGGGVDDRSTMINQYFSVESLARNPGFLGTFEPNRVENSAQYLMMGDQAWLVVSIEFGPRDGAVAWADGVLKAHPDVPAIVVTHAYLYWDGTRYDHVTHPRDQNYSPYLYSLAPAPGSVNDGEEMWNKMIEQNENVRFVISGHVFNNATGDAAASLTSAHPSGRVVHQIVANYQQMALGGGGYLRLLQFCPDLGEVRVSTYSPYLNLWRRDAANQFTLPLP